MSEAGLWRYWTATRTGIYFLARRADDSLYEIRFYDFESRRVKGVAQTESSPIWTYSGLSVSTDAQSIIYAQAEQKASTVMLAEMRE